MSARADWDVFLKTVGDALRDVPSLCDYTRGPFTGGRYLGEVWYPQTSFGSSNQFRWLLYDEYPRYLVPEREVVPLAGSIFWTPADETPVTGGPCPKCLDGIGRDSLMCCPRCSGSGFEQRLARQRELAGYPPPEPIPLPVQSPRASRPQTPDKAAPRGMAGKVQTRRERRAAAYRKTRECPDGDVPVEDAVSTEGDHCPGD